VKEKHGAWVRDAQFIQIMFLGTWHLTKHNTFSPKQGKFSFLKKNPAKYIYIYIYIYMMKLSAE
jgi:hypothetical protein